SNRLHTSYRAGHSSVLGIVRVGDHLDRVNHVNGQIHRRVTGYRIGCVSIVDQSSALRGSGALHVDQTIRSADYARNERQESIDPIVPVWRVEYRRLIDHGLAR